jgi:hypothetical protein
MVDATLNATNSFLLRLAHASLRRIALPRMARGRIVFARANRAVAAIIRPCDCGIVDFQPPIEKTEFGISVFV